MYAKILSKKALEVLKKDNINIDYGILVENIHNIENTGLCPMENLVKDIEEPIEAVKAIKGFLKIA